MKYHPVIKSFLHALSGLKIVYRTERNFRIELMMGFFVFLLALILHCSFLEWAVLSFTVALVLAAEVSNSLLERLIDAMNPRVTIYAKEVKDMTAAAVSILALGSILVGVFIFFPKILSLLFA